METVLVSGGSGYLGALFDPAARSVVGQLGKRVELSNAKATALGWEPRPVEETIADCARSLAR